MRSPLAITVLSPILGCLLLACTPADDTETPDTTTAPPDDPSYEPPHVEAGFLEVPAQPDAANFTARLFYSFHPAEQAPEKAPLLVFFNGGPGTATSGVL